MKRKIQKKLSLETSTVAHLTNVHGGEIFTGPLSVYTCARWCQLSTQRPTCPIN